MNVVRFKPSSKRKKDRKKEHPGARVNESKMLLLSALMIADRLVDLESEAKVFKEKSEDLLEVQNKNKELEQKRDSIESDYQKLEKFVEKMLLKIEKVSSFSHRKSDALISDESSTQIMEPDQPKLF